MRRFNNYIKVTALRTGLSMLINVDSIISVEPSELKWDNKYYTILYLQGHNVSIKESVPDIEELLESKRYP